MKIITFRIRTYNLLLSSTRKLKSKYLLYIAVKVVFVKMAFSFPAFSYIIALIVDAFLIFFSIFHVIAFDELKTDYKNPIDQCNSLNPVSIYF